MTDPLCMFASPYQTVPYAGMPEIVRKILGICAERGIERVVVGLPVQADGREGEGCRRARILSDRLRAQSMACELWDESWTSRDAEDVLRSMGKTRRTAKENVDAIAASLILKDYLESRAQITTTLVPPARSAGETG